MAVAAALFLAAGWWWSRDDGPRTDRSPGLAREGSRTVVSATDTPAWTPDPAALVPELGAGGLVGPGDFDPPSMVTCAVLPALTASSVELVDDALPEIPEVARIVDGVLVIPAPRASGTGILKVPGHLPLAIAWSDGRCVSEPLVLQVGGAAVVGVVRSAEGEPEGAVKVTGCGTSAVTDRDGSFYLEAVPGQPCELQARRADGLLTALGPPVTVTPVANGDVVVELELPPYRTGGIGVVVQEDARGLVIRTLVEGGPGASSGLRVGDRVLAVGGESVDLLTLEGFVDLAVGEPGTPVDLRVAGPDGRERAVTLVRAELE